MFKMYKNKIYLIVFLLMFNIYILCVSYETDLFSVTIASYYLVKFPEIMGKIMFLTYT